jgi:hypothetical protein
VRRSLLLGALLLGGWLVMPGCEPGGGNGDGGVDAGSDAGSDGGVDSGSPPDGGRTDAGQDAGVPTCQGFTAPTVSLQISSACPAFNPCGGNPSGRWVYDGGCIENPITGIPGCAGATITDAGATVTGCVSFSGALSGTVERKVDWVANAIVHFPSTCVPTTCSDLQIAVRVYYPNATCSAVATGGCDCAVSRSGGVNDNTDFVVSGTNIIAASTTYPFCTPTTDILQYREAGSSPQLPQGDLGRR